MHLSEAIKSIISGTQSRFTIEAEHEALRAVFLGALQEKTDCRITRHDTLASFAESVQFEQSKNDIQVMDAETSDEDTILSIVQAPLCGNILLVGSIKSSKLRTLCASIIGDDDEGTAPWVARHLSDYGLKPSKDVTEAILSFVGKDPLALHSSLKALRYALGPLNNDVTLSLVVSVLSNDREVDGRRCLEDLLNQRAASVLRRMEHIGEENLLGLFRATSEELVRIGTVFSLESAGKTYDQIFSDVGGTIPLNLIKGRYSSLGRLLKHVRIQKMLARCNRAETLMRTSRHDRLLVAQTMAMDICRA